MTLLGLVLIALPCAVLLAQYVVRRLRRRYVRAGRYNLATTIRGV